MTPSNYRAYVKSASQATHSKEKVLIMLYDGALKFIKLAQRGIDEKKPAIKGEYISKVIAIITELNSALDSSGGGEIAENLASLYDFMITKLTEANMKNDRNALDIVSQLITEVRDGFMEASRSSVSQPIADEMPERRSIRFAV